MVAIEKNGRMNPAGLGSFGARHYAPELDKWVTLDHMQ